MDYETWAEESTKAWQRYAESLSPSALDLLALTLDYLELVQDEGPPHAGWKSDELLSLIGAIQVMLEDCQHCSAPRRVPNG